MPELVPVLSKDEIREMVSVLARKISSEYEGRSLVLIGVLKGAFIFLADLTRNITIPHEIDFLRAASYGSGTTSSEKIKLTQKVETKLQGKNVELAFNPYLTSDLEFVETEWFSFISSHPAVLLLAACQRLSPTGC